MPPKTLVETVDVYWVQGANGHRGESQVIYCPDLKQESIIDRLFEAGREKVIIQTVRYQKTLDKAEIIDGKPTAHLRYERADRGDSRYIAPQSIAEDLLISEHLKQKK